MSIKKYTKDQVLESAKKYQNQRDWFNNEQHFFKSAANSKKTKDKVFWRKCISHMDYLIKPNGYWTYERCKEIVKNLELLSELLDQKKRSAYNAIKKNGWDDLLVNLKYTYKPNGYWTYETCKEEALKYSKRSLLSKSSSFAYSTIKKNGWEELFSHMKIEVTLKKRTIYAYEFLNQKIVYVGLTYNIQRRHKAHSGFETQYGEVKSPVYIFSEKTGETPILKILTKIPVKEKNAPKSESYYIDKYKNNGWTLLNKAKPGSLGSKYKWTKKVIKKITDECKTHSELREKLPSWVIKSMRKNDWWDELTSHIVYDGLTIWSEEKVMEILPYVKNITEIQKYYSGGRKHIELNPNLKEKVNNYFESQHTKEDIIEIVKTLTTISKFKRKYVTLYKLSEKNGWLDELNTYLKPPQKRETKWTYEICKEEALKFNNKWDLQKNSKGCYNAIHKEKWLELLSHMPYRKKIKNEGYNGKYTINQIVELAKQCKNITEFRIKWSGAHKASKKLNCINNLFV